ncbi:DUF3048 domain-containing protein [Bacillus taeanensis]|uniref:DUF3048 domain-containing protein n=1 Tax=Bacillus taeanensis TaxID=273032 RepID=A0A366XZ09_9BACI|nr:DUF3048 domain-containing protein [Bacillus taeanensis]RBW70836.1 DUF3048 domain-containing protein [Bacillus taeanensis]
MKNQHYVRAVFLVILFIFITACQNKAEQEAEESQRSPVKEEAVIEEHAEEPVEEAAVYHFTLPLTGEKTNEPTNHRPIAVMVNNHPKARPQSGLHKADVVYEVLAEGAVTRFIAIYQSDMPEIIGPVRSARNYYIELSKGYGAFYAAHGYSPEAYDMLKAGVIDHINGITYDGTLFTRVSFRKAPHNSYITYENLVKGAELKGYSLEKEVHPLPFQSEERFKAVNGELAENVEIDYLGRYNVSYHYNPNTSTYYRFNDKEQTIDRESKTPVELKNVFIIEADHRIIDNAGRREINLTSGGKALLLQNGVVQQVEWKNENGRLLPFLNGQKLKLLPGATWINIIPSDPGITQSINYNGI